MALEIKGITMEFDGLKALQNVDIQVSKKTIHAIIGPNGSGKTTLFNCISGIYHPTAGQIVFRGKRIEGLKPFQVAERGIARTFQNIRLFMTMSVIENVMVGLHYKTKEGFLANALQMGRAGREEARVNEKALQTLKIVGLGAKASLPATQLPYGDRRLLELARALASAPEILLIDEPTSGMNETETLQTMEIIGMIRERGITVLLVEHDMKVVMGISDRISVLDHGEKIADGTPLEIQTHERVIEAYLGRKK